MIKSSHASLHCLAELYCASALTCKPNSKSNGKICKLYIRSEHDDQQIQYFIFYSQQKNNLESILRKVLANFIFDSSHLSKKMLGQCLFYHCGVSPLLLTTICKSLGTQETSCWTFFRGGMLSRFSVLQLLNIHGSSLSYFLFHEIFDLSAFHFSIFTHCFVFAQQSLNLHTDGTANCVDWKCP